ncbi:adenylate/guanylate cyclase domain-containing protein [Candidatus Magnetominusculus dajiuhuensis]|uniref:adenylate/guanylate cyclase domain-containing protein n=1 Tax=Candidatus Magnetominusculus dajiuhuensis TaxID=3137712 RepID=UPI003B4293FD
MANTKGLTKETITIMFTDIVGSTAMADFLKTKHGDDKGDEIFIKKIREPHHKIIRQCLGKNNGRELKTIGDSEVRWNPEDEMAIEIF